MSRIGDAVNAAAEGEVLPLVYTAPTINGKPAQKVIKVTNVDFRNNLVRIQQDADPIGFLIAVTQGQLFEVAVVDKNGEVHKHLEQASLKERIKAAKFLTDKIIPKMGVIRHEHTDENDGPGRSFASIVEQASANEQ